VAVIVAYGDETVVLEDWMRDMVGSLIRMSECYGACGGRNRQLAAEMKPYIKPTQFGA
jgi:hypothetical protein